MSYFSDSAARQGRWTLNLRLLSALAMVLALGLAACSSDDEVSDVVPSNIERSPETAMIIPLGAPLAIGVSSALTGPAAPRWQEYRDAVVVAVTR